MRDAWRMYLVKAKYEDLHKMKIKNLKWMFISLIIIVLDQLSKVLVLTHLAYEEPLRLLPILNLTLTNNPGAAFSFLKNAGGWQRWFFILLAIAVSVYIIVWLMRVEKKEPIIKLGLSLVLGGALGNLIDRVRYAFVIDFIQVHYSSWYFPDFNLADSAITVGAILIMGCLIFRGDP